MNRMLSRECRAKTEQSWRYEANFEYRFSEDAGVVNTNLYYHDLDDLLDNVDVSTSGEILSARAILAAASDMDLILIVVLDYFF